MKTKETYNVEEVRTLSKYAAMAVYISSLQPIIEGIQGLNEDDEEFNEAFLKMDEYREKMDARIAHLYKVAAAGEES